MVLSSRWINTFRNSRASFYILFQKGRLLLGWSFFLFLSFDSAHTWADYYIFIIGARMLIACSGIRRNSIAQYLKIYIFFFSDMAAAVFQKKKSDPADLLLYKSIFAGISVYYLRNKSRKHCVRESIYKKKKTFTSGRARVGLLYDNEIPSIVYTSSARVRSSFE